MTIAAQLGRLNASAEMSMKTREFVNLARIVALSRGDPAIAQHIAEQSRLSSTIRSILSARPAVYAIQPDAAAQQKAAVAAGATADSGWALPLAEYQVLVGAFLESLKTFGAFDAMLPSMRRVPFRTRIGASTSGATGTTVPQASVKPISKLTLSGTQIDEIKVSAILVLTDELARFGDAVATNLFAIELSNAVAVATDSEFINQLIFGAISFGSGGATAEHARTDLRVILTAITTGMRSQLFLITNNGVAKSLALLSTNAGDAAFPLLRLNGGEIAGMPVVVSDGVPLQTILMVDASQLAAASETIQLSAASEAAVQMDTSPDSPLTANTAMVSLWQNNFTGLRAERFFGVEKLTTTGVAVLTGVNYTGDSPGP